MGLCCQGIYYARTIRHPRLTVLAGQLGVSGNLARSSSDVRMVRLTVIDYHEEPDWTFASLTRLTQVRTWICPVASQIQSKFLIYRDTSTQLRKADPHICATLFFIDAMGSARSFMGSTVSYVSLSWMHV